MLPRLTVRQRTQTCEQMKMMGCSEHCHRGAPGTVPSQRGKVREGLSAPATLSVNLDGWPSSIKTAWERVLHQPQQTFPPPGRHSFPAHLTLALPSLWLTVKLGLCQRVVPLGLCRVAALRLRSAKTWAIVEPRKARAVHSRRAAWWDFHLKSATASGCLPPPGPAPALQQFLFVPVGLGFCWLELRCDG